MSRITEGYDAALEIREFLKKHNIPLVRIAERRGVSRPAVSAALSGRQPVHESTLKKLKQAAIEEYLSGHRGRKGAGRDGR